MITGDRAQRRPCHSPRAHRPSSAAMPRPQTVRNAVAPGIVARPRTSSDPPRAQTGERRGLQTIEAADGEQGRSGFGHRASLETPGAVRTRTP